MPRCAATSFDNLFGAVQWEIVALHPLEVYRGGQEIVDGGSVTCPRFHACAEAQPSKYLATTLDFDQFLLFCGSGLLSAYVYDDGAHGRDLCRALCLLTHE